LSHIFFQRESILISQNCILKGDILKSPSGGANCIFTDIETLNVRAQEQPKASRKRISVEETIEESAIQERVCNKKSLSQEN
jgi:hypothetical protein